MDYDIFTVLQQLLGPFGEGSSQSPEGHSPEGGGQRVVELKIIS